jgi:hypothetical protein
MGKNPNSFQKRQREMDKKRKAEDKRKRRQVQKQTGESANAVIPRPGDREQEPAELSG